MPSSPETFIDRAERRRRLARWLMWACFASICLWLAWDFVHLITLSRVVSWDEGFVMLTLRGFLDGHALYDDVFTQYGPAYYFLRAPLFLVLDLPVDHDTVRRLTMLTWISAAGLLGLTVFHLTRVPMLAWMGFLQAVVHLSPMADEAGHPQELIVLLLCGLILLHATASRVRLTWWLTAVVVALLILTKINVGAFALLGLIVHAITLRQSHSRWGLCVLPVIALLMPAGLMWRHLDQPWAMTYCAVAGIAAMAVAASLLLAGRRAGTPPVLPLRSAWLVFLLSCGALLFATMALGSTATGMLEGLLLAPARFAGAFLTPLSDAPFALTGAVLSAIACSAWLWGRHDGRSWQWIGIAKLAFGLAGTVVLLHSPEAQLLYLAPWAWLAMAGGTPDPGIQAAPTRNEARGLIAALAAFQLLQAYPVAGSQVAWSTLLLLPLYFACLHDAWEQTAVRVAAGTGSAGAPAAGASPSALSARLPASISPWLQMLVGSALLWVCATFWMDLPRLRAYQLSLQPLDLPGARSIRITPDGVALYQSLTRYLVENSDGFTSYPGYHNLHFWTRIEPPTQANATLWDLLSDAQQAAVVERLGRYERPRIVLTRDVRAELGQRDRQSLRPIERAILFDFEVVAEMGPCIILAPRSPSGA